MINMKSLLKTLIDQGGSDLHITTGSAPVLRIDGILHPMDLPPLDPGQTKQLIYSVLSDSQKHRFEEEKELDFSFALKGLSRFRCNVFYQRNAVAAAIRTIPFRIMAFEEMGIPKSVERLSDRPKGLILVTGPTGSGKSTLLAAMIDKINAERRSHIITIEDPIEFLHKHRSCLVNQREVHQDTISFKRALRSILRQDPDIVLVGEMRDLETIEAAMTIAETGHLTFATLHTNSCIESINRIIDVFPSHQQSQVRAQLSFVLEGVLSLQLIPRASGKGRICALEIMIPNSAIRNLIREDKIHQIYGNMQSGQQTSGMQTMNQSLYDLTKRRLISQKEALSRTMNKDELMQMFGKEVSDRPARPVHK